MPKNPDEFDYMTKKGLEKAMKSARRWWSQPYQNLPNSLILIEHRACTIIVRTKLINVYRVLIPLMERCIDRAFIGNWTSLNSAFIEPYSVLLSSLKMMLHETIRNEDF